MALWSRFVSRAHLPALFWCPGVPGVRTDAPITFPAIAFGAYKQCARYSAAHYSSCLCLSKPVPGQLCNATSTRRSALGVPEDLVR